jgi:hypothetical protein
MWISQEYFDAAVDGIIAVSGLVRIWRRKVFKYTRRRKSIISHIHTQANSNSQPYGWNQERSQRLTPRKNPLANTEIVSTKGTKKEERKEGR